jgi:hypothetical protein
MASAVLDAHRPSLGDLMRDWSPRRRRLVQVLIALAVVALLGRVVLVGEDGTTYVKDGELAFNFLYAAPLKPVATQSSELARFESRRGELFLQSFAVEPLSLPTHDGDLGGLLPALADERIREQARRYGETFQLVQEGKTRVVLLPGYQWVYRFKRDGRTFYGRSVLLPTEEEKTQRGVVLQMLATPASGVGRATDVGVRGPIKKPFRSFRFGTERP